MQEEKEKDRPQCNDVAELEGETLAQVQDTSEEWTGEMCVLEDCDEELIACSLKEEKENKFSRDILLEMSYEEYQQLNKGPILEERFKIHQNQVMKLNKSILDTSVRWRKLREDMRMWKLLHEGTKNLFSYRRQEIKEMCQTKIRSDAVIASLSITKQRLVEVSCPLTNDSYQKYRKMTPDEFRKLHRKRWRLRDLFMFACRMVLLVAKLAIKCRKYMKVILEKCQPGVRQKTGKRYQLGTLDPEKESKKWSLLGRDKDDFTIEDSEDEDSERADVNNRADLCKSKTAVNLPRNFLKNFRKTDR
ncbi:hypothetical protein Ciccas_010232 [Cichlidogyrus casuarinus]|uniref:Uncharacterized protein n=1 Tax=Cichlidogyrus casuarinus TaxID=1844966 RepID=A0ABD2PUR1_9PLAT